MQAQPRTALPFPPSTTTSPPPPWSCRSPKKSPSFCPHRHQHHLHAKVKISRPWRIQLWNTSAPLNSQMVTGVTGPHTGFLLLHLRWQQYNCIINIVRNKVKALADQFKQDKPNNGLWVPNCIYHVSQGKYVERTPALQLSPYLYHQTTILGRNERGRDWWSATNTERGLFVIKWKNPKQGIKISHKYQVLLKGALQLDLWLGRLPSGRSCSDCQPCVPGK